MPIIRVDIPEGQSQETKQTLYDAIYDSIATSWGR